MGYGKKLFAEDAVAAWRGVHSRGEGWGGPAMDSLAPPPRLGMPCWNAALGPSRPMRWCAPNGPMQ